MAKRKTNFDKRMVVAGVLVALSVIILYLGSAIERNFDKWGYSFLEEYNLLRGEGREICSYDEAISQLKDFLIERGTWMDQNIDAIREFSAESAVKKYNENAD